MAPSPRRVTIVYSLRIAEGRTIRIRMANGEEFTIRRAHGSMFVFDTPRSVSVKLIPKTMTKAKKEEPNGNR